MKGKYLGDSYDLVKRFWSENLRLVAPLYAHSKFVTKSISAQYTKITSIPILNEKALPQEPFGLLIDPHTGIPLPTDSQTEPSASHAPLSFLIKAHDELHPKYMICFDQSNHRRHELSRKDQRMSKRAYLQKRGIRSFYYVSHAPFLFMAEKLENLEEVRLRLGETGIPLALFET